MGEEMLAAGASPTPLMLTTCGLSEALSAIFSWALRVPRAEGVNFTPIAQVPLGATAEPVQVSAVLAKSAAFAPASVTVEMFRFAVPLLVMVSVWTALVVP